MEATEWIRNCEFLLKNIKPNLPTLFTNEVSSKLQLPKDEIEKQKTLPYARPTSKVGKFNTFLKDASSFFK